MLDKFTNFLGLERGLDKIAQAILENGISSANNSYKFRAYKSANSNLTDAAVTEVIFNTISFDPGNDFNTTTGRYIAPVTGYYQLNASAEVSGSAGATTFLWHGSMFLHVNGSSVENRNLYVYDQGRLTYLTLQISAIVFLTANDSVGVSVLADANAGTPVLKGGSTITNISGHLLSLANS